ncbi:MAG: type II secretion system major pseudopilin GspG [Planctomycetes bacterium]|nr:type II secretion system major pseudopilin GspG [Planctomycetota bacterium]
MRQRKKERAGFTLVELMVVIVIIGVLAALLVREVMGHAERARIEATKAMISEVGQAADMFKLDHGRYPESLEDLLYAPSYVKPEKYPERGYLKRRPLDGWGNEFLYRLEGSGTTPYAIISYGADGREGGTGDATDISNLEMDR